MKELKDLEEVIQVVRQLRHPKDGCPWDLKQTHKSLLKYLVEESYEFIYEVEHCNIKNMEEELGDVFLQILLHCTIAEEKNHFSINSISKVLKEKLIRRHPHVFENNNSNIDVSLVVKNWEKIKEEEKKKATKHKEDTLISQTYLSFPALFSSYKIGKKTADINFDWENASQVLEKVEEELTEFKDELKIKNNRNKIEEEYGDLLFSLAQLGRHLDLNPEDSLRNANKKFLKGFT